MEKEKLISVIIPIYNVEHYLEKCLDSIVGQSYRNLEIILVDDGSRDGSGEICDRYASRDGRIKVIHRENGGVSAARNSGLNVATGEYLGFADSDDWLESDMYKFLQNDLLSAQADIACCGFFLTFNHIEEPNDKSYTHSVLERDEALELLLQDGIIQSHFWSKLYKRDLSNGFRMPEGKTFEDIFTQHLIFEKARRVVLHNVPQYHYLQRSASISGSVEGFLNGDCHAAHYERIRYFFAKGKKRFFRRAAYVYLTALRNNYMSNINSGNDQACAGLRQRYAAFCREFGNIRFLWPREKLLYDLAFSRFAGALQIYLIYCRFRIYKNIIREKGIKNNIHRLFRKIYSIQL
ncbi:MAG: hypothetical protein CVU55_13080 [Deltaproteobacteria bacterium HGW-Deltaproteobacteria-13]|jgi:glycosyltransferase involved in cell wall biosynthesis|nr:MAG: hypothetical protein CVU55_13080 [Deltaproteobacteria bacterium HGW-Deltaproteobacteria-13]